MFEGLPRQITVADLKALVANEVREGRRIEYKCKLPGTTDLDKKEFLADVSSFANTSGGDLVFGVREEAGLPVAVDGVEVADGDAVIAKFDQMILSGIEPRIRHRIELVDLETGRRVVVIRIRESWLGPHRVVFGGHDKFYARNSTGKYGLDVVELREAFLKSQIVELAVRRFRESRLVEIEGDRTPIRLQRGARLVVHLLPLESFIERINVDLSPFVRNSSTLRPPAVGGGWGCRPTLEGCVSSSGTSSGDAMSYIHVYRNGVVESVDAHTINAQLFGVRQIPSVDLERRVIEMVQTGVNAQKNLGLRPPIYVMVSLIGAKGLPMAVSPHLFLSPTPFDREAVVIPELVLEDLEGPVDFALHATLDLVWNAAGIERSPNFDPDGRWKPRY